VIDSVFGNARLILAGKAKDVFIPAFREAATERVVGCGLDEGVQRGPVITPQSKACIQEIFGQSLKEGAEMVLDGRGKTVTGIENGNFPAPTILCNLDPDGKVATTEIFGPVMAAQNVSNLDEAIQLVNPRQYSNMACIFTSSGGAARRFRYEAQTGIISVNIGVAAPMAFFLFSGWKTVSLAPCMGRAAMQLRFSRKPRWWFSAGSKNGHDNSRNKICIQRHRTSSHFPRHTRWKCSAQPSWRAYKMAPYSFYLKLACIFQVKKP
jgi:acyl-CoA reductase-like NAD-dependent aldehyde dehydrogenase